MYKLKHNRNRRQVEARLDTPSSLGTAVTVIVGLDGYDYKFYRERRRNVHIAMNGPVVLTFAELEQFTDELNALVAEAKEILESQ